MRHRVLGVDPIARRKEVWHEHGDDVTIEHRQDVEPILQTNHEDREYGQRAYRGEGGRTVGRMPLYLYEKLVKEGQVRSGEDLLKYLDLEEARPWKLYPGRVS